MEFQKHQLKNGLRLILAPQEDARAATILVLVEAGSKYETKDKNGISHFLEHMCFKGTAKRPRPVDIATELDQVGAAYNAFTGHESTGYYAKADGNHFDMLLDVISDIYLNPTFDPKEIDTERGVVIEEINMYEDTPMRKVQELFLALMYGDQPAGWPLGGDKQILRTLQREDFVTYRSQHYLANATVVIAAGSLPHDAKERIEKAFAGMPQGEKGAKLPVREEQTKPRVLLQHKESDQTHFVLGVRAFSIFDPRQYVLEVMSAILGGGMSSRLFQKIRGELGAAYYVRSSADFFTDTGIFSSSVGADHNKLELTLRTILEEYARLKQESVSQEELQKAKEYLKGSLVLSMETSDELASFYGGQEILTKSILTPEEIFARIDAVTSEQIQALAATLFEDRNLNLALIGPAKENALFEKILHFA
ncbi:MAG: insulinase family protein [Patescibacteria group bacterium]|nr:insulinase family protein [Patescibacteria group bacterium]MDE2438841.1 insulinase family protein [Patescibacteria group bacterium]